MTLKTANIPPAYASYAWHDEYTNTPFAPDFETRKQAYFAQVLKNSAPPRVSKRAIVEVARLAAGGQPDESVIHESLTEIVEARADCADAGDYPSSLSIRWTDGRQKKEDRDSPFPVLYHRSYTCTQIQS